ncbi:MAG: hypothetical protein JXA09_17900 [Anaerolineae bacterium]|nr:hypothetical protein [Anaerolineae bacterium]
MSDIEPVIEGEIVQDDAESAEVQVREARPVGTTSRVLAWVGAAAAYAGREVIVRVVRSLLDAWDERASRSAAPSDLPSRASAQQTAPDRPAGGARQRRRRARGG